MPNNYIEEKLKLLKDHVAYYGIDNVGGGNFGRKHTVVPFCLQVPFHQ